MSDDKKPETTEGLKEFLTNDPDDLPEAATLGMEGVVLDYAKASRFAYPGLRRLGIEVPRLTAFDLSGFVGAWVLVGALIALLVWLAGIGR